MVFPFLEPHVQECLNTCDVIPTHQVLQLWQPNKYTILEHCAEENGALTYKIIKILFDF